MPTRNNLVDVIPLFAAAAGRTTSRSCDACSQHKNHPKCLKNVQIAVSSANPKGVFCLHCVVRIVGLVSDARIRGVDCRPAKTEEPDFALVAEKACA